MALLQTIGLLAAGLGGYKGKQRQLKREDEEDARRKADQAFQDETRGRQRDAWKREDGIQAALQQAAAPVQGNPLYPVSDDEGNAMPMTKDMQRYTDPRVAQVMTPGQLQQQNTSYGASNRMADAVQGLDPTRANQLRSEADAGKLRGVQIKQAEGAITREEGLREIGTLLARGGTAAIPQMYARYNDGMSARVEPGKEGKGFTVVQLDAQGKEVDRQPYEDMEQFFATVAANYDPSLLMEDMAKRGERARSDERWNAEMDLKRTDAKIRAAREERIARAAEEGLRLQREALEKQAGATGPIWDKDADNFIRRAATVEDPITGKNIVDGSAMEFLKIIALAEAARTGGDTTVAIGRAIAVNQRMQVEAGDDPAKLAQARAALVAQLTGQATAQQQAPASQPTPVPRPRFEQPTMQAAVRPEAAPVPRPGARVVPGQGRALLPWEQPTGRW